MKKIIATLAIAAASSFASAGQQLPFNFIQGDNSYIENQRVEVLSSVANYYDYMADRGNLSPEETPLQGPEYDYAARPYIAIHGGVRSNLGYSLNPLKVVEREARTVIYVEEQVPGETCVVLPAASAPWALIQMEQRLPFNKPVEVRFSKKVIEC